MPRHSREKSGTGIYQMIIGTVPLILDLFPKHTGVLCVYIVVAGTDLGMTAAMTQVPTAIFTLRQILFLCEYFPNANA